MARVAVRKEPTLPERWKDIPSYEGIYQVSTEGRVRRKLPNGKKRFLKPYEYSGNRKTLMVNLYRDNRIRPVSVLRLVAMTFCPGSLDGKWVVHRNGLHSDNSLRNVRILSPERAGSIYGHARRRTVCMLNGSSEVVEIFTSVSAASAATGLSRKTIVRHCDGLPVRRLPDGVTFRWEV